MPVHSFEDSRHELSRSLAQSFVFLVTLFVVVLIPPAARSSAQDDSSAVTSRISVFTGTGFGGTGEVSYDGSYLTFSGEFDLGSAPIAGVRYEKAFLRYLAFGGQFRTSFWRTTGNNNRNPMIDLAMTPRLRYPIVLRSWLMVEPYLVVPVGFSIAIWNAANTPPASTGLDRANPGLSVGALAGVTLLSRSGVGAMLEFGWMHHVAYDRGEADARWTLKLNQATLQAGVVYAF